MTYSWNFTSIPYDRLPHQPGLFLKYVSLSDDALRFSQRRPKLTELAQMAGEISAGAFPRTEMAEIVLRQNEGFGITDSVRESIANLSKPGSVAILTGQQAGLFTGPALTIYKALTALRLSEHLRQRGFNSAAVFWIASDDHDLAEITRLGIPEIGGGIRTMDARLPLFTTADVPARPVGSIRLPESIHQVIEAYCQSVAGERSEALRDMLAAAYQPGATFAEAFGRLMATVLKDRGLILFDPRDKEAKKLAAPTVKRALNEAREIRASLTERNLSLQDSGFQPQVSVLPRSSLVFLEDESARRLLSTGDEGFVLKDTGKRFTVVELTDFLDRHPEQFSPNVLLRPLVQDHLFPTVAYVGGPAEVSYFAQTDVLYRRYGRPAPVIWPRAGFTVVDDAAEMTLMRHGLQVEQCFTREDRIFRRILTERPDASERLLAEIKEGIRHSFEEFRPALVALDSSLGPAADTIERKLLHRTGSLETNFFHYAMSQDDSFRKEVSHLLDCCFPNGNLQERGIGVPYLIGQHGDRFLDALFEAIDLECPAHWIAHPVAQTDGGHGL